MSELNLERLLDLVDRKSQIDQSSSWSDGSSTYLVELRNEIDEVEAEIGKGNSDELTDELGDVLWDYLNLVNCLAAEEGITMKEVLLRTTAKYEERISGIEQGRTWKEIKAEQKARVLQTRDYIGGDV
ncbi:MAG: hypothetical protein JJ921_12745 [Pseudomonadales bacterium]|nr:hypothetical protein [Pseudomonadales bacterium]MBO7006201.1 hypothetical protein [Pseudomonadales bacterium]